ncbi:MAG: histidine kinase dimerization/phospho-acceptor domain-containing protein [Syntrophomonas sp.]|uniref:histidine kinase dimerization/phospho-acceptor domain-containing protein n=1 Tax=Syntrophomonas sp. TaxID=2053627 RepID=UPI002626DBC3|nr:histidine kinase dimerization/phospho-acceptor domain-containing protein [Syntrophomonas sp.]MDD2510920.1 histidine kinase dimerization/phospho-acceptor domain-containing protein [Syntrophomonas sp.]MDD4626884.1 histidine kinase dimerization/phospho-acceptor domain-containing protein [Syntrophomonas sp.]
MEISDILPSGSRKILKVLTADISHELRTPLTFLRGQLEGLQSGSIPPDIENIALLQDEVIRLSHLVKEIYNLSLVENRVVSLNFSRFPITELLEHLTPVSLAMQDKGISYSIDFDNAIKEIDADHDRLLQILLNLLSNAMQHVEQGGQVTLSIQQQRNYLQYKILKRGWGDWVGIGQLNSNRKGGQAVNANDLGQEAGKSLGNIALSALLFVWCSPLTLLQGPDSPCQGEGTELQPLNNRLGIDTHAHYGSASMIHHCKMFVFWPNFARLLAYPAVTLSPKNKKDPSAV